VSATTALALMSILLRSSRSIHNNARFFKRHTLHNTSVSHLRISSYQKFRATDFLNATFRDAMRHSPRRPWQPAGPYQRFRRRFDNLPSNYLLYGILGINGAVFAAWSYVQMFQVRLPSPLHHRSSRGAEHVLQTTQRQMAHKMATREFYQQLRELA
jgi:hypothetical protein